METLSTLQRACSGVASSSENENFYSRTLPDSLSTAISQSRSANESFADLTAKAAAKQAEVEQVKDMYSDLVRKYKQLRFDFNRSEVRLASVDDQLSPSKAVLPHGASPSFNKSAVPAFVSSSSSSEVESLQRRTKEARLRTGLHERLLHAEQKLWEMRSQEISLLDDIALTEKQSKKLVSDNATLVNRLVRLEQEQEQERLSDMADRKHVSESKASTAGLTDAPNSRTFDADKIQKLRDGSRTAEQITMKSTLQQQHIQALMEELAKKEIEYSAVVDLVEIKCQEVRAKEHELETVKEGADRDAERRIRSALKTANEQHKAQQIAFF